MRPGLRHRLIRRVPAHRNDAGFTLIEMMVALVLIGVVLSSVTTFFVQTMSIVNHQRGKQVAIHLAEDALDKVRVLDPTSVNGLHGTEQGAPVNGYRQRWDVQPCWMAKLGNACVVDTPSAGDEPVVGAMHFYRVTATVTWTHKRCAPVACSYAATSLVNIPTQDPVFNTDPDDAPVVVKPANYAGDVDVAVNLPLVAVGGAAPLTWSGLNVPNGVKVTSDGRVTGTPTTTGSWTVTVKATDGLGKVGTQTFTFVVNPPPQLTNPGDQRTPVGTVVSLPIQLTGGTGAFVWTATDLPLGLVINPSSGVITGVMPPTSTKRVDVTVTDFNQNSHMVRFQWRNS